MNHPYLTNRSQYIKLGNSLFDHKLSASGVPQGSVLGPLLFTIYVSPIAPLLSSFIMFCTLIYIYIYITIYHLTYYVACMQYRPIVFAGI